MVRPCGSLTVVSLSKQIRGVLKFGEKGKGGLGGFFSSPKTDTLSGGLFKFDVEKFKSYLEKDYLDMAKALDEGGDLNEQICKLSGSWLKKLQFDKKEYWNLEKY